MKKLYATAEALGVSQEAMGHPSPSAGFMSELERVSGLLGAQRLVRLSLFRFEVSGLSTAAAVQVVERALQSHGLVGALPDGSVGFLYLGPRGNRAVADLALVHHIRELLRVELRHQALFNPVQLTSMNVAHLWADEIVDPYDLVESLCQPTVEPLRAC